MTLKLHDKQNFQIAQWHGKCSITPALIHREGFNIFVKCEDISPITLKPLKESQWFIYYFDKKKFTYDQAAYIFKNYYSSS